MNAPVGCAIQALANSVVSVRDRDAGRVDCGAEAAVGVECRSVEARPIAQDGPLAVRVVSHRETGAVLILLAGEAAGYVIDIARPQATTVDTNGLTAGGIELVGDEVAKRIAGASLPAQGIVGKTNAISPRINDCQPLPDRIIELGRGESVGVDSRQGSSIGIIYRGRNIAQGVSDRHLAARFVE